MRDLGDELGRFLRGHPAGFYWIGYSGGMDSHVLLHLCARLRPETGPVFGGVHVNHGLHPDAGRWAGHCMKTCAGLGLPCRVIAVDAGPRAGESPEEAARNARYRAMAAWLEADAAVLVAQHQDDQAETVLLQLLRGAGLRGLAGMRRAVRLGRGRLLRPLIEVPREALLDYARRWGLDWIDDPTNLDQSFDRNYLRHQILPRLKSRWPGCLRTITRSAHHCSEAEGLLEKTMAPLLAAAVDQTGGLEVSALATLDRSQCRWLLRAWLRRQGFRSPPAVFLDRIVDEAAAAPDRQPRIDWPEGEVRRYRGRLYALRPLPCPDPAWRTSWDGKTPLRLPGGGVLESAPAVGAGIAAGLWCRGGIEVHYRRGGERCRLPGRQGCRPLKKLFQERGVPPWLRGRTPLVYLHGQLAAVAGWWVCEPFAAGGGEVGTALSWRP